MRTESNYTLIEFNNGSKCIIKRVDHNVYDWQDILQKPKNKTWYESNDYTYTYTEEDLTDNPYITIKKEWKTKEDMLAEMFTEFL